MLNLFNLKENKKTYKSLNLNNNKTSKHFPSPLREWKNSIYAFNKNSLNLIPSATTSANSLIKSYFNLYNKKIESKMRTKRLLLRLRRLSSNKYYISKGEFKHTNNKVIINLYVFNRQKKNYLLTLKKWYLKKILVNKVTPDLSKPGAAEININIKLIKRLKLINKKGLDAVKKLNKNKYLLIKALNTVSRNKNYNINTFIGLSSYTENFYKNLMKKSLKKMKMFFYYKQLLYINKSKLTYTYLQYLKKYLENLYNKNVEFNIINIKRFYLNSDIMSESITVKITKDRRKMHRHLNKLKNKIEIKEKKSFNWKNHNLSKETSTLIEPSKLLSVKDIELIKRKYIINNLKYKHVTGFRLEANGRLSKRYTASRSVHKVRYKGNLLNMYSSYKGISSVILKGNLKSNTQYSKLKSKSRIGAFGIKGWISGN